MQLRSARRLPRASRRSVPSCCALAYGADTMCRSRLAAQADASLSEVILSTSGTEYCDGAVPALFPTCDFKQVIRLLPPGFFHPVQRRQSETSCAIMSLPCVVIASELLRREGCPTSAVRRFTRCLPRYP